MKKNTTLKFAGFSVLCFLLLSGENSTGEETKFVTIQPIDLIDLCPNHTRGDRDFKGHGPKVSASVDIRITKESGQREIWANVHLKAEETKRDFTTGEGYWSKRIYTAPHGHIIANVRSGMNSQAYYHDTNHGWDYPQVQGSNLVRQFKIMGDTGGNDVGHCMVGKDVSMSVYFNPINIQLVKY